MVALQFLQDGSLQWYFKSATFMRTSFNGFVLVNVKEPFMILPDIVPKEKLALSNIVGQLSHGGTRVQSFTNKSNVPVVSGQLPFKVTIQ